MEDIVSALKIRLKTPIFGYFMIASALINWKGFFYLFLDEANVLTRINYFEVNTSFLSLIVFPILSAAVLAIIYPWIIYSVALITAMPIQLKEELQVNAEHNLLIKRKELEEARAQLFATVEAELIERAKRDQNVDDIKSEELKNKLKLELESLRNERDSLGNIKEDNYNKHKELMDIAGTYRERGSKGTNVDDRNRFLARARALEEEAHKLLLE